MEMRSGDSAGAADTCNDFATRDLLAITNQIHLIVRINRNDTAPMADNDDIAVAP